MTVKGSFQPRSFCVIPRWLCRNWMTSAIDVLQCLCSFCKLATVSHLEIVKLVSGKTIFYYFETDKMY